MAITTKRAAIPERTLRTDRWWLPQLSTAAGLLVFIGYSTWRAFEGAHYYAAPYVSPFYSPCLAANCVPMRGGADWAVIGDWWRLSPRCWCWYSRSASG